MKKILLTALVAAVAVPLAAQRPSSPRLSSAQTMKGISVPVHVLEAEIKANSQQIPAEYATAQRSLTETQIGNSYYDLQTNSSIQRRILNNSNGTIIATWTYSPDAAWVTRGTGYNYFNGTSWGSIPSATLESERTGWPSPMTLGSGSEMIIAHNTDNNTLRRTSRSTVGSGTWSQTNLTAQDQQVWNRSINAGSDGNTIHMAGMTLPTANAGTIYNGMDGAFLYTRSTNGGSSWDIVDYQIPGTDSSYFSNFDGDAYAIDAQGNTVAIVVGGLGTGVQLFKSTDNGLNWTMTDVLISAVQFEETETLIDTTLADRLLTSDGSVNVLIDASGKCHVWYGLMYIANADITDGTITYYPYTNSIEYWNEDFDGAEALTLVGALDMNANGVLDLDNPGGQYRFAGLVSHPQAGVDAAGCMYVSYTMVREDLTNGSQNYRHTYVISSCDDGCTWSWPIDVTGSSTNAFVECAFPSIARRVDEEIHVVYMADNEPGIAVSGDEDSPVINKIIYLKEDVSRFDTAIFCPAELVGDTFLCLGGSTELSLVGCASSVSWSGPNNFSSTNTTISASDFGTYLCTLTNECGTETLGLNVVSYNGTGGPQVTVTASVQNMCPGESSVLTAYSNIGGVSYLWSNGATTASTTVTTTGTFTVTVQDCNSGVTVQQVTISQPANAPVVTITGDLEVCDGGSTELTVLPVSGATYAWSTGSSTTSTTVNAAGTYTCVIQNCAGTSQASVTVSVQSAPVAGIDAPSNEACEGDFLTVTATGDGTYEWSNGATTAALSISQPSESGNYTVTVTNECGDTATASVSLTINANPAAPVISVSGNVFTSSYSGGTHTWYNGSAVISGQTGASLTLTGTTADGAVISCVYTDDNGCQSPVSNTIVGLEETLASDGFALYPNPSNGVVNMVSAVAASGVRVSVHNALGQCVHTTNLSLVAGREHSFDFSSLNAGVYTISVAADGWNKTSNLIIE